ncbi:kinectin [Sphaerodactylus townsendi]|nr:kinectin [Sphaerodactylus townsendi]
MPTAGFSIGKFSDEAAEEQLFSFSFQANMELLEQMERSITDKDDKIKTVENLLETGLIEMANKEGELKVLRKENASLKNEVSTLQRAQTEQGSFASLVEELQKVISEKDGKIKSVEELLQAEVLKVTTKEKTVQALTQEVEALKEDVGKAQLEKDAQISVAQEVKDLQSLLKGKEEQMRSTELLLKEKEREMAKMAEQLQAGVPSLFEPMGSFGILMEGGGLSHKMAATMTILVL